MIYLLPFIIAIASACHGYGRIAKIYPTLALCIILPAMLYIDGAGWWAMAGVPMAWFWRWVLRTGNQAQAEMKALNTKQYFYTNKQRVHMVWKAHYYNPFAWLLGKIIVAELTYRDVPYKKGDSEGRRFFDTRRRVEIVSGLLPQASVMILLYLLTVVLMV